jgi:hypothetical protein
MEKQSQIPQLTQCAVSRLSLHVHNDIEEAAKYFKIPLALWNRESVYIMQEDRCVFVGTCEDARSFYEKNDGEYCRSRFPL